MSWGRTRCLKLCAAVASVAMLAATLQGGAQAGRTKRRLADGLVYKVYELKGPNKVRVLSFDPESAATLDVALADSQLPGFQKTSSMARQAGALAAVNGDYAQPSGRPVYPFAQDGALDQTARVEDGDFKHGRNFAIDVRERLTYFTHPHTRAYFYDQDAGLSYRIIRVNDGPVAADEIVQFSAAGGTEERPPENACSARLQPVEAPHPTPAPLSPEDMALTAAVEAEHYVERVKCRSKRLGLNGGVVLSAPLGGRYDPVLRGLVEGERVVLGWSLDWPEVFDSIGGNPTLLEDGVIQRQSVDDGSAFASDRHPRTAVAYNPGAHKVMLVTVDGRQPGYSVGMSLRELAEFLRDRLGATDALNLDGGGSTTMVVRKKDGSYQVKGRPSDEDAKGRPEERRVSSALLILPGEDPGEVFGPFAPAPPVPTPSPTPSPSPSPTAAPLAPASATDRSAAGSFGLEDVYGRMVNDAASIGGLSDYLQGRGYSLPGFMRRAARGFRQR